MIESTRTYLNTTENASIDSLFTKVILRPYHQLSPEKNSLEILDELEYTLLSAINTSNEGFVSEDGVVERWVGGIDKEKITKDITKASQERRKSIQNKLNEK